MMTNKQYKTHMLYMDIAERIAQQSYSKRNQVGCVIVKGDNIISMGWNGMPSGMNNECEYEENGKLITKSEVLHAEMNALMKLAKTGNSSDKAIIYTSLSPCFECAKSIYQAGILEVYYKDIYRNIDGLNFLSQRKIYTKQLLNSIPC